MVGGCVVSFWFGWFQFGFNFNQISLVFLGWKVLLKLYFRLELFDLFFGQKKQRSWKVYWLELLPILRVSFFPKQKINGFSSFKARLRNFGWLFFHAVSTIEWKFYLPLPIEWKWHLDLDTSLLNPQPGSKTWFGNALQLGRLGASLAKQEENGVFVV